MAYTDLVKGWHEGVVALDNNDLETALKCFKSVKDPHSKIWFNIGCVNLLRRNLRNAVQAFDKTISKDSCLAVAFFQRGVVHLQLELHEEALSDCRLALTHLRNNAFIDYSQLGLRHKLYAWEVLYNTAAVQCALGQWHAAQECLEQATQQQTEARSPALEEALVKLQKRLLLEPIQLPHGTYFRPRKQQVDQLNFKVSMGKPKLISSVIPNDEYIGFEPLRPQKPGFYEPCSDTIQSRDAGYHRVLVHYYPPDSREVAVKANSLVYVLHKEDGQATVIHDGQKILLPTSLLEQVHAPKAESRNVCNGIPLPPLKQPPTRPNVRPPVDDGVPLQRENLIEDVPAPSSSGQSAKSFKDVVYREAAPPSREPKMETAMALQSSPYQAAAEAAAPSSRGEPEETGLTLQSSDGESRESVQGPELLQEGPLSGAQSTIALNVHCSYTVRLHVSPDTSFPELQLLLLEKLRCQPEQSAVQLSYRDPDSKELTPVLGDEDLEKVWEQAADGRATLWCQQQDADHCLGRNILYQMVALYAYQAEGPLDLQFEKGDRLDTLSEVNEDWLEGHCHGKIGIFPRCFAAQAADDSQLAQDGDRGP